LPEEDIQKVYGTCRKLAGAISEVFARVWRAIKQWLSNNPILVKLLRREMWKKVNARSLFKNQQTVKQYSSQIQYRPVRQVAQ
jgi:hypothetical protein